MGRQSTRRILLFTGAFLVAPAAARSDMGIPSPSVIWPGLWFLLVPVVALEAAVAKRVLRLSWKAAFRVSGEANLVSTLVGIPLMWLAAADLGLVPILLLVSFFITVAVERRVVIRRTSLPEADVKRWSWRANILSYAFALVFAIAGQIVFMK